MSRILLNRIRIIGTLTHLESLGKPASNHAPARARAPAPFISPFSRLNFSSKNSPESSNAVSINNPESSTAVDDSSIDDVSTPELKRRIERYMKGDMEELDSIFEAILARKLSGKHEETDDELMEEFRSSTQQDQDQQFQTDEDCTESDEDSMESIESWFQTDEDSTESDEDSMKSNESWFQTDEDSTESDEDSMVSDKS